jgi:hypothetical protein
MSNKVLSLIFIVVIGLPTCTTAKYYSGGTGEPNDPFIIATPEDLNDIGNHEEHWDKHFVLVADVDLSAYTGMQFNKISEYGEDPFTGVFDGQGYTIHHFTWNTIDGKYGWVIGLFGMLGNGGQIKNLKMENVDVNVPGKRVGGLVGHNDRGTIYNCSVTGRVLGGEEVGGLVGRNSRGTITECFSTADVSGTHYIGGLVGNDGQGTISKSYACGKIKAEGGRVGGLVGQIEKHSTVTDCFATGDVSAETRHAGGLAGVTTEDSMISNCYATGDVSADSRVGGLIGSNSATISNAYSTGQVKGEEYVGGLVGTSRNWVMDCFWDANTSGLNHSAAGECKTTTEMKDPDTFIPWACSARDTWTIDPAKDYPRLAWQNLPGQVIGPPEPNGWYDGGSGTPYDPYRIATAKHLWRIGMYPCDWDKHFVLVNDVNMIDYIGPAFRTIGRLGEEHDPQNRPFTGVFDGNNHVIHYFTWTSPDLIGAVGLFGWVGEAGNINNLGIEDLYFDLTSEYIGGLVGVNDGTIFNCHVTGRILGQSNLGGLVGWNRQGRVLHSCTVVRVIGNNDHIGGLAGLNDSIISYSCSIGKVSGTFEVGGLVAINNGGTIGNSYTCGDTSGNRFVGGLVGRSFQGAIVNSFATGQTIGKYNSIGGLVGRNDKESTIFNSYATGSVFTDDGPIGGLVGRNIGTVTNSYSTGNVNGHDRVGGLVGSCEGGGTTTNSFWNIETGGQTISASGTGVTTVEMQTKGTFIDAGWDFIAETENGIDDIWTINEHVDYPRFVWRLVDCAGAFGVDFTDYATLANFWLNQSCTDSNNCADTDFDFSGSVDFADLGALAQHWLQSN